MSTLTERWTALPPEKKALLQLRLRKGQTERRAPEIPLLDRSVAVLPASYAQERIWFNHQWSPDVPLYTETLALFLDGSLDVGRLARAFSVSVRRHEALRTTFRQDGGLLRQGIGTPFPVSIPVTDLTGLPEEARERELRRAARIAAGTVFDLERGPLLRVAAVRLTPVRHALFFSAHHIAFDGWSAGVLFEEVFATYDARPLPELPVQYADFAAWQRERVARIAPEQIAWWRDTLDGAPPALDLPADRPRPAIHTGRGAHHVVVLPPELGAALKELARTQGATLYMVLLAAFEVLLYAWTGRTDLVVGTPHTHRDREELEPLVGVFINAFALRVRLDPEGSFLAHLASVREAVLGAQAHKDLPFEKLVEELQPPRDLSRAPLFQVLLDFQQLPRPLEPADLTATAFPVDSGTAKLDLALLIKETPRGLLAEIEYSTDLFVPATMARLGGHYRRILEAVAADPRQPVAGLSLLSAAERHALLAEWNDTEAPVPAPVHRQLAERARKAPRSVALVAGGRQVTWSELERRVHQLAGHLRSLGVGPNVLVGVQLRRSADLIVALLAVLEAGGAYLPLDPDHPEERRRWILEDSGARIVLKEGLDAGRMPALPADARPAGPEDLAYVLYTSGSTGRPKGVEVRHRALANFLAAFRRHVDLGPRDVLVAVTTVSFDIAALEIFLPLLCGARLVLADRDASDGVALLRLLERSRATVMQATPATWQLLLEAGWNGLPRLRVLCGGEALPRPLADRLRERGAEVWNLYGPTETTIWSTLARLDGPLAAAGDDRPAPIGRPLANTRALVLGPDLRLVPVLAAGELCLGGAGLARGYRGRPDLTAERFVPDPFALEPGARLYRTGDLARLHPDGTLEILGRLDDQIKVRGFRVEPGEIEAALLRQPEVREAAAAARRDRHGVDRLMAWVAPGAPIEPEVLRRRLQEILPDYLVPARIAVVDRLPRTPNGKIDRRALPDPEPLAPEAGRGSALPATPVERTLARIWGDLLGLDAESLRVRDDFFELGGSSLLTTRLLVRVRSELGLEIPLFRAFQRPTIAGLAAWIEEQRRDGAVATMSAARGGLLPLRSSGGRTPLFLVPPAAGSPLCYLDLALGLSEDQPVYGFQAPGLQDGEAPLGRVEELSALFLQELRAVQPAGPYRLGGWSFGALVALEMARTLEATGETVETVAVFAGGGVQRVPWRQRLHPRTAAALVRSLIRGLFRMPWPRTYVELRTLASWIGVSLPESARPFAQGRFGARLRLVRRLAGEAARSLRVSRRHLGAALRHAPAGSGGPIVLFRDVPDGGAESDAVVALFRGLAGGGLEVVPTPGDHMTMMMDRQNVRALARKLENRLNTTQP